MATEQMAQIFGQLQHFSQQLVDQPQMFQRSLEMQRQQSQAQIETRTDTINRILSQTSNRLPQRGSGLKWQISTCSFTVTCASRKSLCCASCVHRFPENQRLTIEKILQANVHGSGASPMDVDALAKTKGGKKGGKGKDKGEQVKEV